MNSLLKKEGDVKDIFSFIIKNIFGYLNLYIHLSR